MKKRMVLMLLTFAAFLAAVGALKFGQVRAAVARNSSFQPPPEAVTTTVAREEPWPANLSAIGTVAAVHGVMVSADLPGVVDTLRFESGRRVAEGTVLAELDSRQERAQLAAAQSQLELYRLSLERARGLMTSGILAQADLDKAVADYTGRGAHHGAEGDNRPENDPRSLLGDSRHPPGEPRPVPRGGRQDRLARVDRPDLRQLFGPAAGARARSPASPSA